MLKSQSRSPITSPISSEISRSGSEVPRKRDEKPDIMIGDRRMSGFSFARWRGLTQNPTYKSDMIYQLPYFRRMTSLADL